MKNDGHKGRNPSPSRSKGTTAQGRKRNYSPIPVSDILTSSFAKLGIAEKIKEYRVKKAWPECVGDVIAKNAAPHNLIGKTLYCSVLSSSWMTELNYRKGEIIKRLNLKMDGPVVAEIIFRMGSFKPEAPARRPEPAIKKALSQEQNVFIEKTVSQIKDAELKAAIKRAMEEAEVDTQSDED